MEATAVSLGKAVLDGALGYAQSKAAEEIALQLGVERDVDFIKDELQMMQLFLMTADEEQSQNKVLTTWVKQVGVLAYKVEDSLMDFGLYSEKKPFLGCIPRNPGDRRRIAKEVKKLRAKVEDVSYRNLRYRLIKESSGSKPTTAEEQASNATAAMFAAVDHDSTSKVDLHQLITSDDVDLRVIAVWGNNGDLGKTSVIHEEVHDHPKLQNSQEQVSTGNISVAVSDNNDEAKVAALEKVNPKAMHASCSIESEKNSAVLTNEIQKEDQEPNNAGEEKVHNSTARKKFDRSRTLALGDEVFCGRETEKSILIKLVGRPDDSERCKVISVCGMGGLGKITLVRSIYRSRELGDWKRAWATALRPFSTEVLLRDLALQLQNTIQDDLAGSKETGAQKKSISVKNLQELKEELARVLKTKRCLVVLDDISSISEWELVKSYLVNAGRIIVTTRERNIAKHCSREYNMYCLKGLTDDATLDLFIKKVSWTILKKRI